MSFIVHETDKSAFYLLETATEDTTMDTKIRFKNCEWMVIVYYVVSRE